MDGTGGIVSCKFLTSLKYYIFMYFFFILYTLSANVNCKRRTYLQFNAQKNEVNN